MADPVTAGLTAASMGVSALGGVMGAGASMKAASANSQMGLFQAGIALQNAKIAEQNAQYASMEGEQSASKYGMGAAQRNSEIKAVQSASGLDVNSGSNKQVQDSAQLVSNMDMAQIRQNAAKVAFDYKTQAGNFSMQAMGDIMGAQNTLAAGPTNAAASIIGSASSVADKWLTTSKLGTYKLGGGGTALGDPMQLPGAALA